MLSLPEHSLCPCPTAAPRSAGLGSGGGGMGCAGMRGEGGGEWSRKVPAPAG